MPREDVRIAVNRVLPESIEKLTLKQIKSVLSIIDKQYGKEKEMAQVLTSISNFFGSQANYGRHNNDSFQTLIKKIKQIDETNPDAVQQAATWIFGYFNYLLANAGKGDLSACLMPLVYYLDTGTKLKLSDIPYDVTPMTVTMCSSMGSALAVVGYNYRLPDQLEVFDSESVWKELQVGIRTKYTNELRARNPANGEMGRIRAKTAKHQVYDKLEDQDKDTLRFIYKIESVRAGFERFFPQGWAFESEMAEKSYFSMTDGYLSGLILLIGDENVKTGLSENVVSERINCSSQSTR